MINEQSFNKDLGKGTIGEVLGIEITSVEDGVVKGKMPVDSRTHQPYGMLHGGASVVLAETLGSIGSHVLVESQGKAGSYTEAVLKAVKSWLVHNDVELKR